MGSTHYFDDATGPFRSTSLRVLLGWLESTQPPYGKGRLVDWLRGQVQPKDLLLPPKLGDYGTSLFSEDHELLLEITIIQGKTHPVARVGELLFER
jgi:hypothetical protein